MSDSHLLKLFERFASRGREISLGDLRNELGDDAHFILVIFISIPFLQPIPLPGLSTPLGLLIILNMAASLAHQQVWIPKKLSHQKISAKLFSSVFNFYQKVHGFLSKIDRKNISFRHGQIIDKMIILLCGLMLTLPLPIPFTNSLPAWTILLLALAEVENHMVLRFLGWISAMVSFGYFFTLIKTSTWVVEYFS